jgi:hypothetical protein
MNKDGLNQKEKRLLKALSDRKPHGIRELKKLFVTEGRERCKITYERGWGDAEVDAQAQSFVRNAMRALISEGWCDGPHTDKDLPRGTYRLTKNGLDRLRRASKKNGKPEKAKVKTEPAKAEPQQNVAA